jgi:CHAT domain-containing protein
VVGDPVYSPARRQLSKANDLLADLRGGHWNELPGTRAEVDQIAALFRPEVVTRLVDSDASEQSLDRLRRPTLNRFRYLHFATHGAGNDVQAFESALVLAQDTLPPDPLPRAGEPFINGQLSAREVLDFWKLDADLVTLSACETAVGKDGGGDGMLGFAQAFLTAGARSVCLSLWKVDDTATALLMTRFYQNLLGKRPGLEKPLPKAVALHEAKQWLRSLSRGEAEKLTAALTQGVSRGDRGKGEKLNLVVPSANPAQPEPAESKPFADPRYWAAFILIGDPG